MAQITYTNDTHKALYKARRRRQCVFVQQGNAVQTLRE